MRDRGFRQNAMAEIEDEAATGVILQDIVDRAIERRAARDQRQGIEVTLNGDTILNMGADQGWLSRPIDADAIDAGPVHIVGQKRAGPSGKTDDLCVGGLLAHAFDDTARWLNRPAREFAWWQDAGPGIENL